MNRNLAEMVRLHILFAVSNIASSVSFRVSLSLLLLALPVAPVANAQEVYVGGVQSQIGSPGNPWVGPVGVASDTSGNIYIAEHQSPYDIIKIDAATHATSTFLSGACGQSFSHMQGLAADASNNLYIADESNNRLVVYNIPTATCTASYPVASPFAVTLDSSNNVWGSTAAGASTQIWKIPVGLASGNMPTAVITSGLQSAGGLAFDSSGNLYVSDYTSNTVWRYPSPYSNQNSFISFSSGTGGPFGVYFDKQGNLYVCESTSNQVVRYLAPSYTTAVPVSLNLTGPEGIGMDPSGNLFLSAYGGSTITEISAATGDFGQVQVGASQTLQLNFDVLAGTTIGSFQVLDKGVTGLQFNQGMGGGQCTTGTYASTTACSINVTFTPQFPGEQIGAVEVLDNSNNILATAHISGTGLAPLAGFSPGTVSVLNVTGVSQNFPARPGLDSQGNLYVPEFSNNLVVKIAPGGAAVVVPTPGYTFNQPNAVKLDGAGNIYISDSQNNRVIEVTPAGTASALNNSGLQFLSSGMAVDAAGDVYICDAFENRIIEYPQGGPAQVVPITGLATGLSHPYGLALDGAGNLYIADSNNNRIVEVTSSGAASIVAVGGLLLNSPQDVVLDTSGNLYISDTRNNRIVEVPAPYTGNPPVVLSTGSISLDNPIGVVVAGNGTLYIADSANNRIVVSAQATAPTLAFGTSDIGSLSYDSPKTATLLNLGNEPLTIASDIFATTTPTSGTSFAADSSTTCGSLLAANSSCVYAVDFTPVAEGSNVGTLTLTDNTLNATGSTQIIHLSGPATTAPITQLAYIVAPAATMSAGGNAGSAITVVEEDASGTKVVSGSDTITLTVTGPNGYSANYTATASAGVATFNLSASALTAAGAYTYTASVVSSSIASATANETVTAATPATATVTSGSAQSQTIGGAFGMGLSVTVKDAYSNPIAGATVSYSVPASGASAVLSSATATTNASGVASVTATANGIAGAYSVTAASGGASSNFSLTNLKAQPPLTLTASASSVSAGTSITLTATTSGVGGTTPTGTVSFYDGTTLLGTGMLSGGVTTLSIVPHSAGTHPISVVYPGDANYLTATSSTVNETVTSGAAASIAVNSGSAQSKTIGSAFVTGLSVTVKDAYSNPIGGATVSYSAPASGASASLSSATATTNSSGIASVTATANGVAGAYSVTAASGGASATFSLTNLKAQPPLTLTASASYVSAGTSITLTATTSGVGGTIPSGSVTFYDGTASLGTGMLSGGVTTLSIVPHSAGTHPISVVYPGDANYLTATSSTVNEVVTASSASQVAVKAGSAQSILVRSQFPIPLSVTVTDAFGNAVSGAVVTFSGPSTGAASGFSALSATTGTTGVATVTATANSIAGTYTVTATIQGGVSVSFTLTNLPATPVVTVATSATPVFILTNVTYTATVTGLNGPTPTGTVTFYDGTTSLGTASLNSSGVATLSSAPQAVGTHPVTVSYSGNTSYGTGTGNTVSEVAQDFTLAVASTGTSSITILPGSTATFNLVVTPVNGATFPAAINLSATGGASSAPPVLGTSIVSTGASATTVTLTVAVPGEPIASARELRVGLGRTTLALLGLPLLALGGLGRRLRRGLPRGLSALSIAFGALTALGALSGCGFASGYFGQAPATYTYTVTGTAGPLNHSTSVTLNIQ